VRSNQSAQMGNLLFRLVQLAGHLLQQSSHVLLPVEHVAGLFVAFDVVLDFLLKVLVYSLVFEDAEEAFIDLAV
jgi:hypothetical protein